MNFDLIVQLGTVAFAVIGALIVGAAISGDAEEMTKSQYEAFLAGRADWTHF